MTLIKINDNYWLECEYIASGSTAIVYEIKDTNNVLALVSSYFDTMRDAIADKIANEGIIDHVPQIERLGYARKEGSQEVFKAYRMPKYNVLDFNSMDPILAYLDIAIDRPGKFDIYQYLHDLKDDMFIEHSIILAIEWIYNAISTDETNYKPDILGDNLAYDNNGQLILLDIFHNF